MSVVRQSRSGLGKCTSMAKNQEPPLHKCSTAGIISLQCPKSIEKRSNIMTPSTRFNRSSLIATTWSNRLFTLGKVRPDHGPPIGGTRWTSTAAAPTTVLHPHRTGFGTSQTSPFSAIKQYYFSSNPLMNHVPQTELNQTIGSPSQDVSPHGHGNHQSSSPSPPQSTPPLTLMLRDERLSVAQHLDPDGTTLPTSEWIHINGTLPTGSLDQVLNSIEQILREEEQKGIIDLDAEWNPVQDPQVPLLVLDDILQQSQDQTKPTGRSGVAALVEAAHVVLSPFGRPNGWHLKLPNRSLVYSLVDRSQQQQQQQQKQGVRIGWKLVTVHEYQYSKEKHQKEDPAFARNNGLIVDDTMVRIENCPPTMNMVHVRHMVSRYELAHHGTTVLQWKGMTTDGKLAPLTFIVRFASASWARAAVRDLQSTDYMGQLLRIVQYPKQIRYEGP